MPTTAWVLPASLFGQKIGDDIQLYEVLVT
jgi:hypothetical protein